MRGEGIYATNVRAILHHDHKGFRDEVPCYKKGESARKTYYCDLYDEERDVAIEIKSCIRDIESGYGMNWIGKWNWLICPPECAIRAAYYLDSKGEGYVGIMAMDTERTFCPDDIYDVSVPLYMMIARGHMVLREPKEIR